MDSKLGNAERGKKPMESAPPPPPPPPLDFQNLGDELDYALAFELQIQEAQLASLALQPSSSSSSSSSSSPPQELTSELNDLIFQRSLQQLKDQKLCEIERKRISEEINQRIHDYKFAKEIDQMHEDDWEEFGEVYEKPYEQRSSSSSSSLIDEPFKLYFKGLFNVPISAVGVAVCDPGDGLLLAIQKPLSGDWRNRREVELKALIDGLKAAVSLDIKRINLYFTNPTIFQQVRGRWVVRQQRIATLVNQAIELQREFESIQSFLVPGNDLKYAFKLARDAIDSQVLKSEGSSNTKDLKETCTICLEVTEAKEMFTIDGCLHRYCFSCMKQHMEVKMLQGKIPICPHEGCKTVLLLDGCKKFLTPKLIEKMSQLMKESSIPVTQRVYCPYPKCSTLMSKTEALEYVKKSMAATTPAVRKCVSCHGLFCIYCKVPWHNTMTCYEFNRSNVSARVEEAKLKSLANKNRWRQCVKCNHMIELAEGCYHMTCRCGYQFCYTCGAEWINNKPTCRCDLWDEWNIMDDYDEDDDDLDDDLDDELEAFLGGDARFRILRI